MCNLYTTTASAAEVARYFSAKMTTEFNAGPGDVYPGGMGMVVRQEAGERNLQAMTWGFPLVLKSKKTGKPLKPKPVNNARTNKLDSFMWRYSFAERRCLIPLTAWAEAEGQAGRKTRTWLSLPDTEIFAVAGIWRDSDEWGRCYSMVMTDAAGDAAQVHNRMPVVLDTNRYEQWLEGSLEDAKALCRPWQAKLTIERTETPWHRQ